MRCFERRERHRILETVKTSVPGRIKYNTTFSRFLVFTYDGMMRHTVQTSTKLAALLLLHAAGAGLASPSVLITRHPDQTVEWLPRDNQTLYRLEPGRSKRLELNSSSINHWTVFISVSPCASDVRWILYRGFIRGSNGHMSFAEEQKGEDFAIIKTIVSENERYVLQLTAINGGAVAISVRGEQPKFTRMRLRIRSKRRLAAIWDSSPIDPQATTYCVVASTRKNYTSLCAAYFDAKNNRLNFKKNNVQTEYNEKSAGNLNEKMARSPNEKMEGSSVENASRVDNVLDNKINIDFDTFNIYDIKVKNLYPRRKKFSRSTKVSDHDPVIACVGERTRHLIEYLNSNATYYVSVFGVATDRRNGALLATSSLHPRLAVAKQLRESVPYKTQVKGRMVFYFKATLGFGGGVWISASTCGGGVDIEVAIRGKRLYFIKNIDPHQSFFVPAPLMTSSMQETSDESSLQFDSGSSEETRLRYVITVTQSPVAEAEKVPEVELELTASRSRWGPGTPQLVDDGILRELRPRRTCRSVDIAFLPAVEDDTEDIRYCITTREKLAGGNLSSCNFQMKGIYGRQCLSHLQENSTRVIVHKVINLRPGKKYEVQVTASNGRFTVPYKTLYVETNSLCRD